MGRGEAEMSKPRLIETNLCVHWRHSRCVESGKCPFGCKRVDANGAQRCERNGVISDDPKRNDSAANLAYDEMRNGKE